MLTDKMPFRPKEYFRAITVGEAVGLLKKFGRRAAVLAGGTDLLVVKPSHLEYLIDISRLPLDYIKKEGGGIRIGALATLNEIADSPLLNVEPYDVIAKSTLDMGTPITKNYATIGGNICNAAPSADMPPSLIALEAEARITGPRSKRKVLLENFFLGPKKTVLRRGEILTEIFVPKAPGGTKAVFFKKGRTSEDIAQVNVAVRLTVDGDICKVARIVLGAVAPTPIRAKKAESLLVGKKLEEIAPSLEVVAKKAAEETKPISDIRAPAEYRRAVAEVLTRRALLTLLERFKGG
ncbi:MAG: FAD binding domain-containing protein [Candidatus Hadarchaeum sp.]|uniref:FAD binding domain-containing protein n=1 Tax=Candidatus Hadarchaeum sp. TaxID=2883567 RepID=UPI003D10E586